MELDLVNYAYDSLTAIVLEAVLEAVKSPLGLVQKTLCLDQSKEKAAEQVAGLLDSSAGSHLMEKVLKVLHL